MTRRATVRPGLVEGLARRASVGETRAGVLADRVRHDAKPSGQQALARPRKWQMEALRSPVLASKSS
jgi:hypothetical protein